MTRKTGRGLVFLILIGMFVQLGVLGYVFYSSYAGRADLVQANRKACITRGSVANKANARFQRAHTTYITTVTGAKSVKEDVKTAARKAVKTFRKTTKILEQLAAVNCIKAYPKARFFP